MQREFPEAEVFEIKKTELNSPIIFAGFVGAGLVGPLAINHIITELKMTDEEFLYHLMDKEEMAIFHKNNDLLHREIGIHMGVYKTPRRPILRHLHNTSAQGARLQRGPLLRSGGKPARRRPAGWHAAGEDLFYAGASWL